jgi:acetyltransferase-like isoleucine patch superfamily enzyme
MNRFKDWQCPEIIDGVPTKYNWVVQHVDRFYLSKNTDIGAFTYINAKNGVYIREGVQVGSHCAIYSVSTIDDKQGAVILRENSKIGSHCVIMPGVTIGRGAVVGACSFVDRDVPAGGLMINRPRTEVLKKYTIDTQQQVDAIGVWR